MTEKPCEVEVFEIIRISVGLAEAANLTAFLNEAATGMVDMAAKGQRSEKANLGMQYCFFHLEDKIEQAHERLNKLWLK